MPTHAPPATPSEAPPHTGPAHDTLARESELIHEADVAIRKGRFHDAREAIATYTAEIGDRGQLAEEAAGIEVEALCRLHAESAAAKRAEFEQRYPRSLQRAKIATACAANQQPERK